MTCKHHIQQRRAAVNRAGLFRYLSKTCAQFVAATALSASISAAFAAEAPPNVDTAILQALKGSAVDTQSGTPSEKEVRLKAMRAAAQSYGARTGLSHRTHEIQTELESASKYLDTIWNFQPLMLPNNNSAGAGKLQARDVLPPVIVSEDASFKQDSESIIHKGGPNFRILQQARFVPTPPTWRNYLNKRAESEPAQPPHSSLLPKTPAEEALFRTWVKEGWDAGYAQANQIHTTSLNRLARDWDGIIAYYELLRDNVVSLPFVASSNPGVSGDASNLSINDVTLQITVMPAFRFDSSKWSAGKTSK